MNKAKLLITTTLLAFTVLSFIVMPAMAKPYELTIIIKSAETHKGVNGIDIDIYGTKDGTTWDMIGHSQSGYDGTGTAVINSGLWEGQGYMTTIRINAAGQALECKLNPKYGGRASFTI